MSLELIGALLTAIALSGLLWGEARDVSRVSAITKPLASTGFIVAAIGFGALESRYGEVVLVGLVLGAVGDVCLLGAGKKAFIAGLVSFLLGHVAYVFAFGSLEMRLLPALVTAVLIVAFMIMIARWVFPHAPDMRVPISAYMLVISAMVVVAVGAGAAGAHWSIPVGAILFTLSDITVVRNRFVKKEAANRLLGLPMYYVAQLLIAWSITFVTG